MLIGCALRGLSGLGDSSFSPSWHVLPLLWPVHVSALPFWVCAIPSRVVVACHQHCACTAWAIAADEHSENCLLGQTQRCEQC